MVSIPTQATEYQTWIYLHIGRQNQDLFADVIASNHKILLNSI